MDITRAKEIVSALAEGVDPTTGEVLPDSSVCNKGEVVRALYTVLHHLNEKQSKKKLPANAGKPWSKEDDEKLKAYFRSGMTTKEISAVFQRTNNSIASRLLLLGVTND